MNRRGQGRGALYPVQLNSRVSREQMEQIRDSASLAGMSVCKYVRHRATGSTVVSTQDSQIIRELNLIGNYLVKLSKSGQNVAPAITELRAAIAKIQG